MKVTVRPAQGVVDGFVIYIRVFPGEEAQVDFQDGGPLRRACAAATGEYLRTGKTCNRVVKKASED